MDDDDDIRNRAIHNPYQAHSAQGFVLYYTRQFERAIEPLTKALEANNKSIDCYLWRAECFLKLGQFSEALQDIKAVLQMDHRHPKGLQLQGEIFYEKGDFEEALMVFHRGKTRRPFMKEFSQGISKTSIAIDHCCGGKDTLQLTDDIDLTSFRQKFEVKPIVVTDNSKKKKAPTQKIKIEEQEIPVMPPITKDNVTCRRLLGDLYGDRKYLNMVYDTETGRWNMWKGTKSALPNITQNSIEQCRLIQKDTVNGAVYLDKRMNFWHQKDPRRPSEKIKDEAEKKLSRNPAKDKVKAIKTEIKTMPVNTEQSTMILNCPFLFIPNGMT